MFSAQSLLYVRSLFVRIGPIVPAAFLLALRMTGRPTYVCPAFPSSRNRAHRPAPILIMPAGPGLPPYDTPSPVSTATTDSATLTAQDDPIEQVTAVSVGPRAETSPAASAAVKVTEMGYGGHANSHAVGVPAMEVATMVARPVTSCGGGYGGHGSGCGGCFGDFWGSGDGGRSGSGSGSSLDDGARGHAGGNCNPPSGAPPPCGRASGGEQSAAVVTSAHPPMAAINEVSTAYSPQGPSIATVGKMLMPHPRPPVALRGPDGRLLPLKLSAAAITAAWANAPPPMPAYPRWDAGSGGYIGVLLQWLDEGRISLRDTAPGEKVKAERRSF